VWDSLPAGLAFTAALCILVGWWVGRRITQPLAALAEGARALHETHFAHRVRLSGNDEFAEVAASMNEMAERVGEQMSALEEDARRRRQVLADVAHELRSPVATLKAMTAALRDGVANEPERRVEALTRMHDSAGRMERLVSDLLEVSRLDLHEVPLVRAPVDLRELAEDAVYTHARAAEQAGVVLEPAEEGEPVMVEADRLRLSQALDNLVENAVAYAGSGAAVRVRVQSGPPRLTVEDTGVGIASKHLPFLFDAFYRADAARTPGGTHSGLGLRIARGLVEAHGGTLTLESEEGHGTRARITLPGDGRTQPINRRAT
jgi:signal transduction histidine kinase